ncbi:hypothetical protein [Jeotgalibaca caeni]|uniref:hypothetical protein n=1 Tax=Jeotgalibaca caeni TaxID=3028623 RepID=UPI00237DB59E|nr:hypothetical protein [Jeotgalibaca caeni]MDE1549356.1 hypothetical protein [Jeotgalibaca caeni]
MNRTIKFQLSNLKTTILYSALISYGGLALIYGIYFLYNRNAITDIFSQPIWVNLLSFIATPIFLLSITYALWDGMVSFDASIRFGTSRRSYFITQLFIYIILSVLVSAAAGISEVEWAGSASNYFTTIGKNYLSLGYIMTEFLGTLLLAILTLSFYRFKSKTLIPIVGSFGLFIMFLSLSTSIDSPFIFEIIIHIVNFVIEYRELFIGFLAAFMIGVYYLFITRTEVQD